MRAVLDAWPKIGLRELIKVKAGANVDPAPVSTTARTAGSVAQLSSCWVISLRSLIDSALRRSGRARVIVATPSPATCVAMSRLIAPPKLDV